MSFDTVRARDYVQALDLRGTWRSPIQQSLDGEAIVVFDTAREQAQIVGSGVFAFEQGVTPEVREAISDSALLAQLVANKKVVVATDPLGWFTEYSKVLENIGWTMQEGGWVDYTTKGRAAQVHDKILEVAAALTVSAAGLAILTSTVQALRGMSPNSPFITLFERDSKHGRFARFQIGLVSSDTAGDVFVSLLACVIEGTNTVTQLLFFKYREAEASFRADSAKVSINKASLRDLGDAIRQKTRAYQRDYLSGILNL